MGDLATIIRKIGIEDIILHHILDPVKVVLFAAYLHHSCPLGVFGDNHPTHGTFGTMRHRDMFGI